MPHNPVSTFPGEGHNEKLNAAAAIKHVSTIKDIYQQRLAVAPVLERDRIASEGANTLRKAIIDEGLSLDEYDSIIQAALNDPSVPRAAGPAHPS